MGEGISAHKSAARQSNLLPGIFPGPCQMPVMTEAGRAMPGGKIPHSFMLADQNGKINFGRSIGVFAAKVGGGLNDENRLFPEDPSGLVVFTITGKEGPLVFG